jgi:hypothetical protein
MISPRNQALRFSTHFHSQNRISCDEQPLLRKSKREQWFRAREIPQRGGHSGYQLNRVSFRSTYTLTPYIAIFCLRSSRTSERNYKKANTLPQSTQGSSQDSTANSLFQKILRVTPSGSRFCRERRRSIARNINKMNILQNGEEKKWGGTQWPAREVRESRHTIRLRWQP